MKINLKKSLVLTTVLSTTVATIGISSFIVGGYGNNISTLSEIQNSGFFGINTAFEKEKTTDYNTKELYINHLRDKLKLESEKNYDEQTTAIKNAEIKLTQLREALTVFEDAVVKAQEDFDKNRTDSNKTILNNAKADLERARNSSEINNQEQIIQSNNSVITKINESKEDFLRLDNHAMWNSLFITGTTLFAIGTIVAITATSYSVYLKKSTKNK